MRAVELACQVAAAISMGCAVVVVKAARFGAVETAQAIDRRIHRGVSR